MFRYLVTLILLLHPVALTANGSGGTNDARHLDKPYVVLVSIDGARWDYPGLRESRMLRKVADEGIRAERLLPVYPTLTFPNHFTIVTGLYPANHGIVANDFPLEDGETWYRIRNREQVQDGANYRGEPAWVTAEKQGMVSASFFWVGSEADIQGIQPSHWRLFDGSIEDRDRVNQVLGWLSEPAETRPHLITLYFEEVDDYSHWYGAGSLNSRKAMRRIDREIRRLFEGIDDLPHADRVNVIIVSDHGLGNFSDPYEPFSLDGLFDHEGVTFVDGGSYLSMWLEDSTRAEEIRNRIRDQWRHGQAWLKSDAPPGWNVTDDPRFPDVMLVADAGKAVVSSSENAGRFHPGDHGWSPDSEVMHGIFLARGPAFKTGFRSGPVRSVDINPLVLHILGLDPPPMDGRFERIRHVLRDAGQEKE